MRIGIVQSSPLFGKVEENLCRVERLMGEREAELWVLPEFFATGYQFTSRVELERLADRLADRFTGHASAGRVTQRLIAIAQARDCHIVAGIPEIAGDILYNTAILVSPAGILARYRKVHLFFEEKRWFTPGDTPFPVVNIGAAKVGLMICYDHFFPEAARTLALRGAEIIAHPANLVMPGYAQMTMRVRAMENAVFTVTANRVGRESRTAQSLCFTGESQIVSPQGEIIVRLSPDREEARIVDIDPCEARDKSLNQYNDRLADRRPAFYLSQPEI